MGEWEATVLILHHTVISRGSSESGHTSGLNEVADKSLVVLTNNKKYIELYKLLSQILSASMQAPITRG